MIFAILAGVFFVGQNLASRAFSKNFEKGLYPLLAVNALAALAGTAALFLLFRPGMISGLAMLFAAAFGALFVATISMIMVTYSQGPMGISAMIIDMSVMISVLFGMLLWHEVPTPLKGIALAALVVVLVLLSLPEKRENTAAKRSWLLIAITTMIMNGLLSVIQKSAFMVCPELNSTDFTFWSMAMAGAMSALLLLAMKALGKKRFSPGQPMKKLPPIAAAQGLCTAAAYFCLNLALTAQDSIMVFPVTIFVTVAVLMLLSILFFGEKLSLRKGIAFVMGLAGTVLMNL